MSLNRLLTLTLFLYSYSVLGQEVIEISTDSSIIDVNRLKIWDTDYFVYNFKNVLPDGTFKVYGPPVTKKKGKTLVFEGQFLNGKREGAYRYYGSIFNTQEKKIESQLYIWANYKDGELHGQFVSRLTNVVKIAEGNYNNGEKDGFFIRYNSYLRDGSISELYFFSRDSLISWTFYRNDGSIKEEGSFNECYTVIAMDETKFKYYDWYLVQRDGKRYHILDIKENGYFSFSSVIIGMRFHSEINKYIKIKLGEETDWYFEKDWLFVEDICGDNYVDGDLYFYHIMGEINLCKE